MSRLPAQPLPDLPPGTPADLEVVEELSRSPRARVLRVRRPGERQDSVLRIAERQQAGADAEIALFARVAAAGLVAPTAWGRTADGRTWLLRPFIEGRPFADALREAGSEEVATRVRHLLSTLAALHEAGFVHRDIKSANVLVGRSGTFLVDLDLADVAHGTDVAREPGVARATSAARAAVAPGARSALTGASAGSPLHMAPEVLLGQPHTPRSDLFSVGAMLALAFCGMPSADFHRHFPARSFWQASGLDPGCLSAELTPLVQALVRRHPDDRPASARAAAALLQAEDESAAPADASGSRLAPRGLPFLAGREAALARLVGAPRPAAADDAAGSGRALAEGVASGIGGAEADRESALVTVRDPEELPELADQLQLAFALAGRRAALADRRAPPDRLVAALQEARLDAVVLTVQDAEDVERALALLLASAERGPRLIALAGAEQARALNAAIRQRDLGAEASQLTLVPWPRTPRGALEQHLRRITGDASPGTTAALAAHAHEITAGRHADLDRLLASAVEDGVLRADGALYTPLRTTWPHAPAPEAALAVEFGALAEGPRGLLVALSLLGASADRVTLDALLGEEALPAQHVLRARGILRDTATGGVRAADPRWLEAARCSLDATGTEGWTRRCMAALAAPVPARSSAVAQAAPADAGLAAAAGTRARTTWARLAATRARSDAEWAEVLDVAECELAEGRVPAARELAQMVGAGLATPGRATGRRLALLSARLELAQGRARDALDILSRAAGEDLGDASNEELLVAAHAAEQAGRRQDARRWLQRVLDAPAGRAQELDALRGLGYAAWLEGRWQDVLEMLGDAPLAGDPDEPAVALLNLRGVACVRLQRWPEAEACFAGALARCVRGGAPLALSLARTELNRALLDRRRGRPAQAVAALRRAEAAFDVAGHVAGRALALHNLGVLHRDLGDLAAARALLQDALALRRRTGDTHGVAATLGSLALLRLDAGQLGAALAELEAARARLAGGAYAAEAAVLELHRAMALALAGRHVDAAGTLLGVDSASPELVGAGAPAPALPAGRGADLPAGENLSGEQPALHARATALVRACAGELSGARQAARQACEAARAGGDAAESFRAAALLLALSPADGDAVTALEEAARQLGSPVRDAELSWRTAAGGVAELRAWLAVFERAGRTDLVCAVARELGLAADAAGDLTERRRAAARAAEATDALVEALPAAAREAARERIARWLSGAARGAADPRDGGDGGDGEEPRQERPPAGVDVAWLLTCSRRMAAEDDLSGLLLGIVDSALELTGARRGLLVLLEGEAVSVQVARGMDRAAMPEDEVRFSLTVVRDAVATGRAVVTTDAAADSRFRGTQSIESFGLRSVLCVPLRLPAPLGGALYLDNDQRAAAFDATDAERTGWLADQASLAIANLRRRAEAERAAAELTARHAELQVQRTEIESLNRRLASRVATQEQELTTARTLLRQRGSVSPAPGMVGDSEAMQRVYTLIDRLGPTELPVLVTGPSGTGKDLVARALHSRSRRADKPLVIENVAALPPTLLESELFGHVRGAFTGADRDRPGLFAEADGGTFFLDEIGDMPLELQAKLLRVLETGEVRPVGGRRNVRVDVRIVAATHRDLPERVRDGAFREDLFYRLNGAEIRLPPLAERLDDIPLLVASFLERLNGKHGTQRAMSEPVARALARRAWPGQVRELGKEDSRLYFLSGDAIDDPSLVRAPVAAAPAARGGDDAGQGGPVSLRLEDAERVAVQRALTAAGGRKDKAARLLDISRAGLYAKLARLGLAPDGGES